MKYEDYRKEDLVFLTKTDWAEEEMKEVIDTFPESRKTEHIRKALNDILIAIEKGTLKTNTWNHINMQSAKAYANRHDYVWYGKPSSSRWDAGNCFHIVIDGTYRRLDDKWDIKQAIKYLDNITERFNHISYEYREAEKRYKKETETQNYEDENRERIITNRIADQYLSAFSIRILNNLENYRYSDETIPDYRHSEKTVRGSDYRYCNSYGEITFCGKVCSEEDAEKIIEIMKEANRKAQMIMDRVDIELREIQEKYRDEQ